MGQNISRRHPFQGFSMQLYIQNVAIGQNSGLMFTSGNLKAAWSIIALYMFTTILIDPGDTILF